jgi:hypothetical protein
MRKHLGVLSFTAAARVVLESFPSPLHHLLSILLPTSLATPGYINFSSALSIARNRHITLKMETPKQSMDRQCGHCGKSTELACNHCKDTYYCGKDCQLAQWSEHQSLCAEDPMEKAVLRGGWLLKKLFLASRQRASTDERREWQWNAEHTCLSIIRSESILSFKKFSPTVAVTEEEREMIWTARHSKNAVGFFFRSSPDATSG